MGEDERCRKLSDQLEVSVRSLFTSTSYKVLYPPTHSQINPNQYIQAHTILKNFSYKYSDKSVLVLGGQLNKVREVAKGYCCAFSSIYDLKLTSNLSGMDSKMSSQHWIY